MNGIAFNTRNSRPPSTGAWLMWYASPGGGFLLQHAPLALWPIAAAANLVCAAGALALEGRLPENVRITPLGAGSAG